MTLSSLIVQREVATMRQVEEALARQVIYGGDLATNLLEVASVDERVLTQLVAETMRLPAAPSGELPVAPESVRSLVPPEVAAQRGIVPFALEGEILVLAVAEPMPPDVEEQLMFALGMAIEQRAASAVRIRQAIARTYGLPLERRMQRLIARLSGAPWASDSMAPPLDMAPPAPRAPAIRVSGAPGSLSSSLSPSMSVRRHTSRSFPAFVTPVPPAEMAATNSSAPPPSTAPSPPRGAGLIQRPVPSGMRSARRRRGPITLDGAKREADEAYDRDGLLDLFFDFSRQFFDYAALFLVHGDIAEGRDAFGAGASRERVIGIGVPLDLPSLMSRARDDGAAIVANAPADGLDAVLLADLQRPNPAEMAIVPLVVRTRTVAMVLGDCGDAGVDQASMHQLGAFAAIVGKALERIIVRRKLEGFIAAGRASDPAGLDGSTIAVRATTPSLPPPPANVATVRRLTGAPIPREEPDEAEAPESRPEPEATASIPAPEPPLVEEPVEYNIPRGLDARALFDILGWETGAENPDVAPPSSALAVPPHRPPLGHTPSSDALPSVIVDMDQELAAMVDRVVNGEPDESAEAELLRQGERAMSVIMSRFPGPVTVERTLLASTMNPPRASECGPLLRLIARERKVALPFVLERLSDSDADSRGWATHLLCELPYTEAIPKALARLCDPDAGTRASAEHAVSAIAKVLPDQMREAVRELAGSGELDDRAAAIRTIARLRLPSLAPDLIGGLADSEQAIVLAAHDALVHLTWQDFGRDARPWLKWWEQNASRHRIEWLIDALTHEVSEIRRGAGEELRTVTREYFGYAADLPPRDRDRAQQRYRDWWITEGRTRLRRR
jgi:hypothetical protein